MKLYEIANEIMTLSEIDDSDESLQEAIKNSLDDLNMEFNDKVDNILKLAQSLDNNVLIVKNEIYRLSERKKSIENKKASLINYLINEMETIGISKVNTDLFTASVRKGRNSVVIDSMEDLPLEYIVTKVTDSANKKALQKALKEGDVPGSHLERGQNTLTIK